jgi:dipeptidyl aminopeptidase/acylaminoacyl peptidase
MHTIFKCSMVCISLLLFLPLQAEQTSSFTIDDYFKVERLRVSDMSRDGRWLVATRSTRADSLPRDNYRYGDPTYVAESLADVIMIDTSSGKQTALFPGKVQVSNLSWSPDGGELAFFKVEKGGRHLKIWNRKTKKVTPVNTGRMGPIASNSHLLWSENGEKLFFAVRASGWEETSREMFKKATLGPIIVQDSDKPFLLWDKIRRLSSLKIPLAWERKSNTLTRLLEELPLLSVRLSRDGIHMIVERDVTEKTSYEVIFGTRNQMEVLNLEDGSNRVLLKPYDRRRFIWDRDSGRLAYSDKGDVFFLSITDEKPRNLTGEKEDKKDIEETDDSPEDKTKEPKKRRFSALRFSPDGTKILCTSTEPQEEKEESDNRQTSPPQQFWLIDIGTGDKEKIYELPEEKEQRPNLRLTEWSPDGATLYFTTSAKNTYDRGLTAFDLASRTMRDLIRSDHLYGGWQMSEDGSTLIFTDSDGRLPEQWYASDPAFKTIKRLTNLNAWAAAKSLCRTELISYRDTDGEELHGVLYYPAYYEKGKRYPLITEVYESYFDNGFNPTLNIFTSAGYAVLHPSVDLERGYPGEAWAKGALSAINKVIEMGVADPDKLGIQGTSYGGYATVLLITQTDRFKAAINNSGKVNMVSFYTQSPKLGVRNTHAPENSQDRIGGTLWEYPERYLAHSAVLYADRIKTPLLCITGDQDPNVEAIQSMEIYYALRRLGKKVVWLRYHNGAHGGPQTNDERKDMYRRMLDWYNTYLMGKVKDKSE